MRDQSEENEQLLRKTSNKIKENNQKVKKNDRKNEEHDRKKYLNKNDRQTVENCDFNAFFARD